MKKCKKVIAALLAITAMAGLCSCGPKSGESDVLLYYTFGDKPADHDMVMAEANKIIEEEIGVTIDMQYIDSASYQEKMKLKMASGDAYDLCFAGYCNPYQTAVDLGGLYDITELLKEKNITEVIPQFYLDAATVDGKIYGIPNIQVVSNPICISMSKSLAEELDIDMQAIENAAWAIEDEDDMEHIEAYVALLDEMFAKIKAAKPDMYVFNPQYSLITPSVWEGLLGETTIESNGSSDELFIGFEKDLWWYQFDKVGEWYQKGYIRQDIASKGIAVTDDELKQYAVKCGTWKPGQDLIDIERFGEEHVYARIQKPYIKRHGALETMIAVGADSKNPEKAVEFLKLINSNEELYNLICWGIEGKHYTKDAEGFVTEIPDSGYNNGTSAWKFGNQFNSFVMAGQSADIWEETEKMNNEAIKSPFLGFVPDTTNIATEIANITNVGGEFTARIVYGTKPSSEWRDEFLAKMEQAGVHKVRDEFQKQYDEFLASKN